MKKTKNRFTAKEITGVAVLLALVIVLQAVGGTIVIGPVQLNFTLLPIVLGGILFGSLVGAFLGFVCGLIVVIQLLTGAGYFSIVILQAPVITALTCLVKTTVAGFVAGLLYKLIAKKNETVAVFVASATVPIVNTFLFIVGCLLMDSSGALPRFEGFEGVNVFVFILVGLITFNFFIELAINVIFAPAIQRVIKIIERVK